VLDAAAHGALNIHASLLPRWRGAAPIQRAILAGDAQTGVSIMQMDAGLDTGAVLAQSGVPIAPDDDAGTLHDKLAVLGARIVLAVMMPSPYSSRDSVEDSLELGRRLGMKVIERPFQLLTSYAKRA